MTIDKVKIRKDYYNNNHVLKKILEYGFHREIAILDFSDKNSFYWRCNWFKNDEAGLSFLKVFIEKFKVAELETRNLYFSSALYSFMPNMFTKNSEGKNIRKPNDYFWDIVRRCIRKYNILLDFDLPAEKNRNELTKELLRVLDILDLYKFHYYILFSGNGFHVHLIDLDFLSIEYQNDTDKLFYYSELIKQIKEKLELKYLCLFNAGIYNRISKISFSLSGENIVLPINYEIGKYDFLIKIKEYSKVINMTNSDYFKNLLSENNYVFNSDKKILFEEFCKRFKIEFHKEDFMVR